MALKIVWTKRAHAGFSEIVEYLEFNFSEKEVRNFIHQSNEFFELLSHFPEILERSSGQKDFFRGPMNKHTILTYRVNSGKNQIELINIRASRKKPLK